LKTHCPACGKSSLNFIHKQTGRLYCSSCGQQIAASETILAALVRKGAFLPDDFFSRPEPEVVKEVVPEPYDARAAAMRRIQSSQRQLDSGRESDMSRKINIPKMSREEATARKRAIVASLANTDELISQAAQPPSPDLASDFAEIGLDLGEVDSILKSDQ
jgi:hypothetical protein